MTRSWICLCTILVTESTSINCFYIPHRLYQSVVWFTTPTSGLVASHIRDSFEYYITIEDGGVGSFRFYIRMESKNTSFIGFVKKTFTPYIKMSISKNLSCFNKCFNNSTLLVFKDFLMCINSVHTGWMFLIYTSYVSSVLSYFYGML